MKQYGSKNNLQPETIDMILGLYQNFQKTFVGKKSFQWSLTSMICRITKIFNIKSNFSQDNFFRMNEVL